MYLSSRNRSSSYLYPSNYNEQTFARTSTYNSQYRRKKSQQCDREIALEKELWILEKKELKEQLDQERQAHRKSVRMIEQLISDNQKYSKIAGHHSHGDQKKYYNTDNQKYRKQKQFSKTCSSFETKDLKQSHNTAHSSINPENHDYIQEQIQRNKLTKAEIFKKLSTKKQLKIKKKVNHEQHSYLTPQKQTNEEIIFLKQQLQDKNTQIVDLQCQIIKLKKQLSDNNGMSQNQFEHQILTTKSKQFEIDKNCVNVSVKGRKTILSQRLVCSMVIQKQKKRVEEKGLQTLIPSCSLSYMPNIQIDSKIINIISDKMLEEEQECLIQKSLKEYKESQAQTSQNFYDYIEQTYLDWVFEKDYQDLQARKQKQKGKQEQNTN